MHMVSHVVATRRISSMRFFRLCIWDATHTLAHPRLRFEREFRSAWMDTPDPVHMWWPGAVRDRTVIPRPNLTHATAAHTHTHTPARLRALLLLLLLLQHKVAVCDDAPRPGCLGGLGRLAGAISAPTPRGGVDVLTCPPTSVDQSSCRCSRRCC